MFLLTWLHTEYSLRITYFKISPFYTLLLYETEASGQASFQSEICYRLNNQHMIYSGKCQESGWLQHSPVSVLG